MDERANFPDLAGSSVFITGGGSGIGASLTDGFLEQGAKVTFVQRSDASDFCDSMEARHGVRPHFISCDLMDLSALKSAISEASARHGHVNVLVNNAADDQRHSTEQVSEEFWDSNLAVNLRAYFFACQFAIEGMRANGGGAIVNFSSISYMMGNSGYPVYVTANSAINGMTRALAREFGPDGIRVNTLAPGWVLTEKQLETWATPQALSAHLEKQCIKEHLKAADIVGAALFLASNSSRMITGQTLAVDGGVVVTG